MRIQNFKTNKIKTQYITTLYKHTHVIVMSILARTNNLLSFVLVNAGTIGIAQD